MRFWRKVMIVLVNFLKENDGVYDFLVEIFKKMLKMMMFWWVS